MFPSIITRLIILHYGTLCPGVRTYKAFMSKNTVECSAWMKYWISHAVLMVFATLCDMFLSWVPLYQVVKLFVVIGIVKSAPRGSAWLFDILIDPLLSRTNEHTERYLNMPWPFAYEELQKIGNWCIMGEKELPTVTETIFEPEPTEYNDECIYDSQIDNFFSFTAQEPTEVNDELNFDSQIDNFESLTEDFDDDDNLMIMENEKSKKMENQKALPKVDKLFSNQYKRFAGAGDN